ncbi:cupin fold metalloprotein, WbuC family [Andreprevotia lacus DSM 23236]|jgi:cupin fold WbuC family metalloprotein|uniref:Cupin fold metalloprotein, WbuC family n=1 Tax=Andreprevotia lacus DSM 23236 TaxID=1121001 RepID=A0A1W1XY67_9NEIS|nr:WbuC family cupin fold metalloprotein [Andreprevotia lacus]SMC28899.1 cupin fold metalloprotein, WbuC family [Andreprevotia lacus DSM 23236]
MSQPRLIDQATLAALAAEAAQAPRLRKNQNFHADNADACHRLINALQPGTYIQPHRHLDAGKSESIIALAGSMGVLYFDEGGRIEQICVIAPGGAVVGVNVPAGTFHSLVALTPDCVFFESKAGPYAPLETAEKAAWAPAEGEPAVSAYLQHMLVHFNGLT